VAAACAHQAVPSRVVAGRNSRGRNRPELSMYRS
jgi:hypothetical protein